NRLRLAFNSPGLSNDELTELVATTRMEQLPPSTLFLLVQVVSNQRISDERVQAKLREVQRLNAGDFWLNFGLARFFESTEPPRLEEAVRYYAVALALRPDSAAIHSNLG